MSTYLGVIAASQKNCNCGVDKLIDLYVEQDYFYLTSHPYTLSVVDTVHSALTPSVVMQRINFDYVEKLDSCAIANYGNVSIRLRSIAFDQRQPISEACLLGSPVVTANLVTTVEYGTYTHSVSESGQMQITAVSARLVDRIIDVDLPNESVNTEFIMGVTLA